MEKFRFLARMKQEGERSDANSPQPTTGVSAKAEQPPREVPAKRFRFLEERKRTGADPSAAGEQQRREAPPHPTQPLPDEIPADSPEPEKPTIRPGSDGEHRLQEKFGSKERALCFYDRQVVDFLSPLMQEFIARQEFLFVATAERNGECDCTPKFGKPGFIRVLGSRYLMYPEYRGNGVMANLGNISENPHIALLIIDFTQDTVGLHVNGKARIVENENLREFTDKLPGDVITDIDLEGKKCPERWVMVEVEEAYIQCSKHIPLMKKMDKRIDWGTDSVAAKRGDYFQLQDIPLYERVGGDKAMEIAVDLFYRKVLQDELVGHFFEDVDMEGQRLKQKSFLSMAFGGPYRYSGLDLRKAHKRLVEEMGLSDEHFDRVGKIFHETLAELNISGKEIEAMMEVIASSRDDVLNR